MTPRLITFDAAQTLIDVRWTPESFIRLCCAAVHLEVPEAAYGLYMKLYGERLPEFLQVNLTQDVALGRDWWVRLTRDWLTLVGLSPCHTEPLVEASDVLVYGPDSELFRLYEDVVPCLDRLAERSYRLAVISNWDYSLHRILKTLGVYERFELVLASLEQGVEKPDPRLFQICLDRLSVSPDQVIHVGDNPIDDLEGAASAGIQGVLIDRSGVLTQKHIRSLDQLEEALDWSA